MIQEEELDKPTDSATDADNYSIRSASNVLKTLDLFITQNSLIGVAELRKALNITANMAFRILHTLEKAHYIVVNPDTGKYHLSLKLLALGRVVTASLAISKVSLPFLKLLANELHKVNVVLLIYECGELIIAERIDSRRLPIVYAPPGRRLPIHATAGGKLIMSEMSAEELSALQEKGFEQLTENTITDMEALAKEFDSIRESHIAWERGEHTLNLNGIAAAVRDRAGKMLGCVTINGFVGNVSLEELEGMQNALLETTRNISEMLAYVSNSDLRV